MNAKAKAIEIASSNKGVVGIKLKSGEMLVSTILDMSTKVSDMRKPWTLKHPCQLLHTGGQNMGILPWLASDSDKEPVIDADIEDQVVAVFTLPEDVAGSYLKMTGQAVIDTPSRRIIV